MTAFWIALIAIGAIGGLAAGIWLVAIAFRESIGWGIACLLGIPAIAFVVRYWEDVKTPFVYSLVGCFVAVTGVVGYSVSSVNADLIGFDDFDDAGAWDARPLTLPDEPDTSELPDPQSQDDGSAIDNGDPEAAVSADEGEGMAPSGSGDNPPEQRTPISIEERRRGFVVPIEKLELYTGERVVITLKNRERVFVYIVDVGSHHVEVQRNVGGGSVTFSVNLSQIQEVRVRKVL